MTFKRIVWVLVAFGAWAVAGAQPLSEAEQDALAEVREQQDSGLFAVQPWAQVLGEGRLGIGWLASRPAAGVVEWTQCFETGRDGSWREAWYAEDGLRQGNGTAQRAIIEGYDPAKPIKFRARLRPIENFKPYKVSFGPEAYSQERFLPAFCRPSKAASFVVFNDVHNREYLYPLLMVKAGVPVDFAVFNGDVLQDPQSEREAADHLLAPMAWFTARSIPCFFLRGNHETRGAFARELKDYLALPGNRYFGAITVGSARVLLLDSGEDKPDTSGEYSGLVDFDRYIEQELAWLKREIASTAFRKAAWRIVVMHIPPDWSVAEEELWHGQRRARERFAPLFDEGHVTAVISGHTHRAKVVEPCPDAARGFRWPIFIGGAHPLSNATVIRVDADDRQLRIRRIHSDGTVGAERVWRR